MVYGNTAQSNFDTYAGKRREKGFGLGSSYWPSLSGQWSAKAILEDTSNLDLDRFDKPSKTREKS